MTPVSPNEPAKQDWFYTAMTIGAVFAVYFIAGKLGLKLAFLNESATAVWPPSGIALAAFLLLGYRVWPAIFAGAFFVNLTTTSTIVTSVFIAVGNTLEGVFAAYVIQRFANGRYAFDTPRQVFLFIMLGPVLSAMVSATVGVTTLAVAGFAQWTQYSAVWLTWWLGDAAGMLIVTPLIMFWVKMEPLQHRIGEAVFLVGAILVVSLISFGGVVTYPLDFLYIPLVVWSAFRFGRKETAVVVVALCAIAIGGTLQGFGPFVRDSQNESLVLLQAFMAIVAVVGLLLSALVTQQRMHHSQREVKHRGKAAQ